MSWENLVLLQAQHFLMFNKRLGFQEIAELVKMESAYQFWCNSSQILTEILVKEQKTINAEIRPESWRNSQLKACGDGLTT